MQNKCGHSKNVVWRRRTQNSPRLGVGRPLRQLLELLVQLHDERVSLLQDCLVARLLVLHLGQFTFGLPKSAEHFLTLLESGAHVR